MKIFTLFFACLLLSIKLWATDCIPNCECETDWTLEVRGAYYSLPHHSLKKIYTAHWIDYQVETAKRIHNFVEVWGGVSWASKKGHSFKIRDEEGHKIKDKTKMFILPFSLGLKFIYPILSFVDAYIGAGACYSFLKIKNVGKDHDNDSRFSHSSLKKSRYKNSFGAIAKIGFQLAMSDSTFLDFFVDYYYQNFHFSHKKKSQALFSHNIDCSGFKFGAGFGVYF